ncbi:unnamed protein product [Symbiodinium sp. CCMP2456]|nr:unnamed protein product [Symbiodinium sp. CCMP2456]
MAFPQPVPPLDCRGSGDADVLLIAPHATVPADNAGPFIAAWPHNKDEVTEEMNEWHDEGSGEAFEVAVSKLAAPGFRPRLPRGLMDLNRGWRGRTEKTETLFGKGALSSWAAEHIHPDGNDALEKWYRAALSTIQAAAAERRGFVEIHSYGDLGSTYDRESGGRPVRRAQAAVVHSTPWATQFPVGLARLLPGDLRGTPKPLERALDLCLEENGFKLGPSPYPTQGPWALSTRFLASRWFLWLGEKDHLPKEAAEHLASLAWQDEHDPEMEAVATGKVEAQSGKLRGVRELAVMMSEWSHRPGDLGDTFGRETRCFTLVVEMRCDRTDDAESFGQAVAKALSAHLAS